METDADHVTTLWRFTVWATCPFEVQARYASAPFIKQEVISAEYSTVQQYATLFTVRYLEIIEALIGQQ